MLAEIPDLTPYQDNAFLEGPDGAPDLIDVEALREGFQPAGEETVVELIDVTALKDGPELNEEFADLKLAELLDDIDRAFSAEDEANIREDPKNIKDPSDPIKIRR